MIMQIFGYDAMLLIQPCFYIPKYVNEIFKPNQICLKHKFIV